MANATYYTLTKHGVEKADVVAILMIWVTIGRTLLLYIRDRNYSVFDGDLKMSRIAWNTLRFGSERRKLVPFQPEFEIVTLHCLNWPIKNVLEYNMRHSRFVIGQFKKCETKISNLDRIYNSTRKDTS